MEKTRKKNEEYESTVALMASVEGNHYKVVASQDEGENVSMTITAAADQGKYSNIDSFHIAKDRETDSVQVRALGERDPLAPAKAKVVLEFFDQVVKNLLPEIAIA